MPIAKAVRIVRMSDADDTREYWLERTPAERFEAIEAIRAEAHGWTDESGPRPQRVCRVLRAS